MFTFVFIFLLRWFNNGTNATTDWDPVLKTYFGPPRGGAPGANGLFVDEFGTLMLCAQGMLVLYGCTACTVCLYCLYCLYCMVVLPVLGNRLLWRYVGPTLGLSTEVLETTPDDYEVVATGYNGKRFNSPNDGVTKKHGTKAGHFYITDPIYGLPLGMDDPTKVRSCLV